MSRYFSRAQALTCSLLERWFATEVSGDWFPRGSAQDRSLSRAAISWHNTHNLTHLGTFPPIIVHFWSFFTREKCSGAKIGWKMCHHLEENSKTLFWDWNPFIYNYASWANINNLSGNTDEGEVCWINRRALAPSSLSIQTNYFHNKQFALRANITLIYHDIWEFPIIDFNKLS